MQSSSRIVVLTFFLFVCLPECILAGAQPLTQHVPSITQSLQPMGTLSTTAQLRLAISLPLRNEAALSSLLTEVYDPASPKYHRFLTPGQFTEQFGPTASDYAALRAFLESRNLHVVQEHNNRLLVDVTGSVADIQQTFNLTLRTYRHPNEDRIFFAPDREPSGVFPVAILHISGLDNYSLPKPRLSNIRRSEENAFPNAGTGSGPGSAYMGNDFRAAYVPTTTLNGSGQIIGLLEFDGYTPADITYYESKAGLPNVPLTNVLIDGATGGPSGSGGEVEVSLDIEVAASMAPATSNIFVYMAPNNGAPFEDILNRMATDNLAKQIACCWFIPGGTAQPAADAIWQEMALQGQSFYCASGDSDAYAGLINFPSDSPYITQVGGTTLTTTGPGGAWAAETVWNWGGGIGSSGGISTQYSIPNYQTNISMASNQGSTTMRNVPDVALTGDNVYVRADGYNYTVGGTSCAAPLWAGFTALVNQEAVASGRSTVGFINPAVDAIGTGLTYANAFHDIVTGNNTWSGSPSRFYGVTGYDLCTGWGTPAGQFLIDALANPEPLIITPASGFNSAGGVGGPFTILSQNFSLTNAGSNSLNWIIVDAPPWLNISPTNGTLQTNSPAVTVSVGLNSAASNLPLGNYSATIWFTNLNDNFRQSRQFSLNIISPPSIVSQPSNQAVPEGSTVQFTVGVTGGLPLAYQWQFNGTNLTDGGNISGSATTDLTVTSATEVNVGSYSVVITNAAGVLASSNAMLSIIPSPPVITVQPTNETLYLNRTARFSVSVVGNTPYSYQWTFDSTNITGATNAQLVITNAQFTDAGTYTVTITNSLGSTNSANAVLTVNPPPPCAPVADSVISWWAGESNALDNLGVNNGIYENSPTYTVGEVGTAFSFNGLNQCVLIPDSPSLHVTNALTIEAWIYMTATSPANSILVKYDGADGVNESAFSFSLYYNTLYLNVSGNGQPGGGAQLNSTGSVPTNVWTHVAATYDGSTISLYINGELDSTLGYTNGIYPGTDNMAIGGNVGGLVPSQPAGPFSGYIDEIAMYKGCLSADQIETIYQASFGGKCPIPVDITAQPLSQTNAGGLNAFFDVGTIGSQPMTYQWYFDGTSISNATSSSLTLTNLSTNQNGTYYVTIENASGTVVSSNATLTVLPAPLCDTAPSNIVSWWMAQSNTLDSLGLNNGAPINSPTYGPGEVGTAFSFNGVNQCVLIPDSPSLHFTNALTIEAWIYMTATSPANSILVKYDGVGGINQSAFSFSLYYNTLYLNVSGNGQPGGGPQLNSVGSVPTNVWTHVAATYNGTSICLYINGNLDSTLAYTGGIYPGTDNMAIGANVGGLGTNRTAGPFAGKIDSIAIYNRALSASEISAIYNASVSGKCPIPPQITMQPASQTATYQGQATFNVAATGFQPMSYQWYFNGTNINGATKSSLTLTNILFNEAGSYSVLVSNSAGSALSSNAILTVSPLYNFVWSAITSPQIVGVPFPVAIQAENPTNNQIATNFSGSVAFQTTNGIPVSPAMSGQFTAGTWTGSITVSQVAGNLVLESIDSVGEVGLSSPLTIVSPPALNTIFSGGILYVAWPVAPSGFTLEVSPNLEPGTWVPVSVPPIQAGGQYLLPVTPSQANAFYRLIFTGP